MHISMAHWRRRSTCSSLRDLIWSAHFKSLRLLHVDLLLQCALEICMGDVYGAKLKVLKCRNGQDGANGGVAHCGSKCLLEIKARTLRIAFGNQSGFVAFQGAISIVLHLHEPSGANCTLPRRQFDDLPSAIEPMCFHLFLT